MQRVTSCTPSQQGEMIQTEREGEKKKIEDNERERKRAHFLYGINGKMCEHTHRTNPTVSGSRIKCVRWKGRSGYKMEETSPNHCTPAPHKGKKAAWTIWIWIVFLLLRSFSAALFLSPCFWFTLGDKSWANKASTQSIWANSANKLSVGSSLFVLTHFTVSVAKQRLKCLATRRHSILMKWLPHARLPCAWSVWL